MSFESDYIILVKHAKAIIGRNKVENIDAEDAVNDAYLAIFDSNQAYSFELAKKLIFKSIFSERTEQIVVNGGVNHTTSQICIDCNELLPSAMFGYYFCNKRGRKTLSSNCKKCTYKRNICGDPHKAKGRIVIEHSEIKNKINPIAFLRIEDLRSKLKSLIIK